MKRVLVVGAQPGSLGEAVERSLYDTSSWEVVTAGLTAEEYSFNLLSPGLWDDLDRIQMIMGRFTHIVCTAGVNRSGKIEDDTFTQVMSDSFRSNVVGPMNLLQWFLEQQPPIQHEGLRHFVAISSNSASIARRGSAPYCASKAALSMALRVVAREQADSDVNIYGYEPGWIDGTPMSESVAGIFAGNFHRIPGGKGVKVDELAAIIVNNLRANNALLNGCMLRLDGGEQ